MASSQGGVLEKLAALELDRRAALERRREEQAEQQNPQESIRQFLQEFRDGKQRLEEAIDQLCAAASGSDQVAKQLAQQQVDAVAADVLELERAAADASYYLPSYDQRAAAAAIAELKQRAEGARGELLPKKKFAFSKRARPAKGPPSRGAAAAEAAAAAGPGACRAADQGAAQQACSSAAARPEASSSPGSPTSYITAYDQQLVRSGRGLQGLRGQVVVRTAADIAGRDFVLLDLHGCTVHLLGAMPALRLHTLRGCTLYTGPVTGAVFANNLRGCTLYMAPYQCRIHHTFDTDFYLRVGGACGRRLAPSLTPCVPSSPSRAEQAKPAAALW
jgi:hypothetical protein